jgi:hypothetical protein
MNMSIQTSQNFAIMVTVQFCLTRQEVCNVTPFSLEKTVAMTFPDDGALLNLFFFGMCSFIPKVLPGFGSKILDPDFIPNNSLWEAALKSYTGAENCWWSLSFLSCVHLSAFVACNTQIY